MTNKVLDIKGIRVDSFHAALTDNLGISKLINALFAWLIIGYTSCFTGERQDESSHVLFHYVFAGSLGVHLPCR